MFTEARETAKVKYLVTTVCRIISYFLLEILFVSGSVREITASAGSVTSSTTRRCEPDGLTETPLGREVVLSSLNFVPNQRLNLKVQYAYNFEGRCAASVKEYVSGIVRLFDGSVYHVTKKGKGVESWLKGRTAFDAEGLEPAQVPSIRGMRLLDADNYEYYRVGSVLRTRYVGLWTNGRRWTVASFSPPSTGGKPVPPSPVFHSTLPLRSVTYFPGIHGGAGLLWVVQVTATGTVRTIGLNWIHDPKAAGITG